MLDKKLRKACLDNAILPNKVIQVNKRKNKLKNIRELLEKCQTKKGTSLLQPKFLKSKDRKNFNLKTKRIEFRKI